MYIMYNRKYEQNNSDINSSFNIYVDSNLMCALAL